MAFAVALIKYIGNFILSILVLIFLMQVDVPSCNRDQPLINAETASAIACRGGLSNLAGLCRNYVSRAVLRRSGWHGEGQPVPHITLSNW